MFTIERSRGETKISVNELSSINLDTPMLQRIFKNIEDVFAQTNVKKF